MSGLALVPLSTLTSAVAMVVTFSLLVAVLLLSFGDRLRRGHVVRALPTAA